ncbi:RNA polymerase sigma factor [Sphingobacterium daejeonense]|uniref:RNA polymerase sigma factor n=1 Tax=Sphingobacterium daejeonense TaxID=371142 RepID=A0ABW3RKL3_9SPHI
MKTLNFNTYSDIELQELMAKDNPIVLKIFMHRYEEQVYQFVLKFLKSPQLAEEVTQDIFLKLWETRNSPEKIQSIAKWLYTVARNRSLNLIKQNQCRLLRENYFAMQISNELDGEDEIILRDYQNAINSLLESLPSKRKEIYMLKSISGLTNEEIALQLNISPHTVKNQLTKSYSSIKKLISYLFSLILPFLISNIH